MLLPLENGMMSQALALCSMRGCFGSVSRRGGTCEMQNGQPGDSCLGTELPCAGAALWWEQGFGQEAASALGLLSPPLLRLTPVLHVALAGNL